MVRKIVGLIVVLVVIVIVAVVGVFIYADQITKVGVETAGSKALGVKTTVEDVDLMLLGGALEMGNLAVANPQGYQIPNLMQIGQFQAAVDIGSLRSETIEIRNIEFTNLQLTIEQKGLTNNVNEILEHLKSLQQNQPETEPQADEGVSKKGLRINRIHIEGGQVHVKLLPVPGQVDKLTVNLGPITLEDISDDSNKAALTATVIRRVMVAILQATVEMVGSDLPAGLLNSLEGSLAGMTNLVGSVTTELSTAAGDVIKGATEGMGKAVEDAGKALEEQGQGLLNLPGQLLGGEKSDDAKPAEKK